MVGSGLHAVTIGSSLLSNSDLVKTRNSGVKSKALSVSKSLKHRNGMLADPMSSAVSQISSSVQQSPISNK